MSVLAKQLDELPVVLTPKEAAHVLRLGRNGIYEAIHRGDIASIRVGNRILIPRSAIEALLNGERDDPASE